jgi:hypothetical protein
MERPVRRAYVFGSYARKEAVADSDLDILVELDHSAPIGMQFFAFQAELSDLLKKKVDLISAQGLSPHIKPIVERERILIYDRKHP